MHGRVHVRLVRSRADDKPRQTASPTDNPRIASSLLGNDADARLEPDTIFVDQAGAGHRYMKEVRRHFGDAIESRFPAECREFGSVAAPQGAALRLQGSTLSSASAPRLRLLAADTNDSRNRDRADALFA